MYEIRSKRIFTRPESKFCFLALETILIKTMRMMCLRTQTDHVTCDLPESSNQFG